jgi:maleylacetoacetate isomerase
MTALVLHDYWRSSAAYRVRIGLNLLGLAYRSHRVDLLAGEQTGPENLARNPQGLVPSLEIDGLVLTQSLAILEYLDETRSAGWLPQDPAARARVRALAHTVAMDIHPICNLHVVRHAVAQGGTTTEDWMQHFITLGLTGIEGMLMQGSTGPYSAGSAVSLADICLVPQVYNARRWGVDMGAFPRIVSVDAALCALRAFGSAHPDAIRPGEDGPAQTIADTKLGPGA